jgi:hypothetical protein
VFLEEERDPVVSEPPGPADPVEIRFGVVRVVLIYDHVNAINVYTPA